MDSQKGMKPVKRATTKPARKANKPIQKNKIFPQNEQKATMKALKTKKEVLFTNFNNILAAVLNDPTLWTKPEFQPLHGFSAKVIGNPQMFAHALPNSHEKKKFDGPSKHPPLTKGLTRSLYARQTISNNSKLIVIVMAMSQKFHQFNILDTNICTPVKQFTMAVIDGDGKLLTLKADTSLNQSMGLVEKGNVLRLTVFVPIYV
jgi:hypothetical protein